MIISNTQLSDLQSYEFKDLEPLSRNKPEVFSGLCDLFDISFFNCSTKKLTSIKHVEQRYRFQEPEPPPASKRQIFMLLLYPHATYGCV